MIFFSKLHVLHAVLGWTRELLFANTQWDVINRRAYLRDFLIRLYFFNLNFRGFVKIILEQIPHIGKPNPKLNVFYFKSYYSIISSRNCGTKSNPQLPIFWESEIKKTQRTKYLLGILRKISRFTDTRPHFPQNLQTYKTFCETLFFFSKPNTKSTQLTRGEEKEGRWRVKSKKALLCFTECGLMLLLPCVCENHL